jgi:putative endonuclease
MYIFKDSSVATLLLNDDVESFTPFLYLSNNMVRGGTVYIMTNFKKTTLYVGVTSDLVSRVLEHKNKKYPNSFTARYNITSLVYYEIYSTIEEAIKIEKYIKGKSRKWKEDLINQQNPKWKNLWYEIKDW